jgi:hypothetical protein
MSDETYHRYSLDDDLEEAAERVSRELPGQIRRLREQVAETRRKLMRGGRGDSEGDSSGA